MGRDYNMTLREAAELIVYAGKSALNSGLAPDSTMWMDFYREAVKLLDSALRTEGQ